MDPDRQETDAGDGTQGRSGGSAETPGTDRGGSGHVRFNTNVGSVSLSVGSLEAAESCKKLRTGVKLLNQLSGSTRPDETDIRKQMQAVEQERSHFETWKMHYEEASRIKLEDNVEASLAKAFGVVRRINPLLNTRAAALNNAIPPVVQAKTKSTTQSPSDTEVSPRKRTMDSGVTGVPKSKQSSLGGPPPPLPNRALGRSNSD